MSFSIDTSSSYGSIFDHSKALKQSQDAQKTNFANAFIKEQALKANDISNANLQSIAKEMALQEVLSSKSNSNNSAQSLSNQALLNNKNISDYSARILNELAYQSSYSSPLQTSIYALKFRGTEGLNSTSSTRQAYGYSVDNEGFMGADFNKAAGLPEDIKVHKSTLDKIQKSTDDDIYDEIAKSIGLKSLYSSIDMAHTVGEYYKVFDKLSSNLFSADKTSFSQADLDSFPKGYSVSTNGEFLNKSFDNEILVFKDDNVIHEANSLNSALASQYFELNVRKLDFSDKLMSNYEMNENGEFDKSNVFEAFIENNSYFALKADVNPIAKAWLQNPANSNAYTHPKQFSLDEVMSQKVDIKTLLEMKLQDGFLDGSIYAFEKGVEWKDTAVGFGRSFDAQFKMAQANGYKPSSESANNFINYTKEKFLNMINVGRI